LRFKLIGQITNLESKKPDLRIEISDLRLEI